jgi:hypothetical protein
MPYHAWNQFRRQRRSLGLPVNLPLAAQAYAARQLIHGKWQNHATFDPADVPLIGALPAWLLNNGGLVTIQTAGLPAELLQGIRNYGALLESVVPLKPRLIRSSAGGCGDLRPFER